MIEHIVSISVDRESTIAPSSSPPIRAQTKITTSNQWRIFISGELESDNPSNAIKLLHELQEQVNKIRKAYGNE